MKLYIVFRTYEDGKKYAGLYNNVFEAVFAFKESVVRPKSLVWVVECIVGVNGWKKFEPTEEFTSEIDKHNLWDYIKKDIPVDDKIRSAILAALNKLDDKVKHLQQEERETNEKSPNNADLLFCFSCELAVKNSDYHKTCSNSLRCFHVKNIDLSVNC